MSSLVNWSTLSRHSDVERARAILIKVRVRKVVEPLDETIISSCRQKVEGILQSFVVRPPRSVSVVYIDRPFESLVRAPMIVSSTELCNRVVLLKLLVGPLLIIAR